MKKLLMIVAIVIASYSFGNAQEIGVRIGTISVRDVAIDGIFTLGEFSRIHTDISFGSGVEIDAIWDFLYRPVIGKTFNLYAGVGPYIQINTPLYFGVAGEIGLEYRFPTVPIALGFDWRPALSIIEKTDLHTNLFGVNIRYVFGD